MTDWCHLARELDLWHQEGRIATLWWRDDDAVRFNDPLRRLLTIASELDTPICLAVIPRDAEPELAERLRAYSGVSVLQHGWGHDNHASADERQEEYGHHRPLAVQLEELARARSVCEGFPRFRPVLVAPWNRIHPSVAMSLPSVQLRGLSTLGPRTAPQPFPGVFCVNVHVDIIDWSTTRGFMGEARALKQLLQHLELRRTGRADADEPTGVMTHHAFHDEGCWQFIADLVGRTRHHPAVRWLDGAAVFPS